MPDTRVWMYHKEQAPQIFASRDAIPDGEGWMNATEWAAYNAANAEPVETSEPAAEPDAADNGDEEAERQYLRAKLKEAGEKVPPRAGVQWMRDKAAELEIAV